LSSAPKTDSPAPTFQPLGALPGDGGRNALQALLAFACIHEQAKRRRIKPADNESARFTQEEVFALDEVLQLVADRAAQITGADGVAIALAEDNAIICRGSSGQIAPDRGVRIDPNSGFSGACLRSGQTVRCDDSETDTRVNAAACRALGTRSMVAVPLSARQRVIGLVEAFSTETYGFNDSDVRSLNLLAELILAAIRPEEEDRLAELSKRIVVPEPAPPVASATAPAGPRAPSRILVDEFLPPPFKTAEKTDVKPADAPTAVKSAAAESKTVSVALPASAAETLAPPAPAPVSVGEDRHAIVRVLSTVAAVMVAAFLLWALIWKGKHVEQAISANTQPPPVTVKESDGESIKVLPSAPLDVKSGPNPQVTGIRHWSTADSSTVIVDLEDQVEYEAHALDNPPRMYFDLHDTRLAPGLANQVLAVNDDPFLKRIRMAQPVEGITRVVLETKQEAEFSFKLDRNPYRLTIEVHKPGSVAAPKTAPFPPAKPSPAVSPKKDAASEGGMAGLRIVLDPGHGGWDLGTIGRKGLLEKDLVLDITERLGELLQDKLGAQVTYTRSDDSYLPLEKRAEIANLSKADLFLSVHANYSDLKTARGVETYYTNTYSSIKARTGADDPALQQVNWTGVDIRAKVTDSHRLAADIQQALYGGLAARNPDIRNRGVKEAQYVVLTGTQMPAILAEVSFVSSPADEDKLESSEYRQLIAQALYRGVVKYQQDVRHTKLASAKKLN
jgi:N-acetylmuramoyl-L-alanine amidase/putative methionine-R-sulfoxide reductase with GAF domain